MAFWLIALVVVLNHGCLKGAKVLMSLTSIELGASPATIGVLYAMYSLFPALLSVYAGKLSDRHGFRSLATLGSVGLCAGLLLPYFFPGLGMLFVSASLAGGFRPAQHRARRRSRILDRRVAARLRRVADARRRARQIHEPATLTWINILARSRFKMRRSQPG